MSHLAQLRLEITTSGDADLALDGAKIGHDVSLSVENSERTRGAETVLTLLVSGVVSPVALSVFSNWLYDRLRRDRTKVRRITLNEEEIVLIPGEIERVVRRHLSISTEE